MQNQKKAIGITGCAGFVGTHLTNWIRLLDQEFNLVPFQREWFSDPVKLASWIKKCDVIVHLAGVNRSEDESYLYETNVNMAVQLTTAFRQHKLKPHVLFSSSTQEEKDNAYGRSKKLAREILAGWAEESGAVFTGMIIPNVFGPYGRPFHNSGIATFCYQLTHNEIPVIIQDTDMKLIYIDELVQEYIQVIRNDINDKGYRVSHRYQHKVSQILDILKEFKTLYFLNGEIPLLKERLRLHLFNTFRSSIDIQKYFSRKYLLNTDERGTFVELARLHNQGQVSFSTTKPGITRGNHFHTRKVERFAVIKGQALIELRKFGTNQKFVFELDGDKQPAYVDMPVWYTHNIRNTGDSELITIFWINEFFDPADPDTYYEIV